MSESPKPDRLAPSDLDRLRPWVIAVLTVGVLGVGATACAWLIHSAVEPNRHAESTRLPDVEVLAIEPHAEEAAVVGHGTVRPKHQIDIIPQVSGQLTRVHPSLAAGKVISKGEVLFEIASDVYEARVRQAEAEIRGLNASLARHDAERTSLDERIVTAQEMVAIELRDDETSRKLYEEQNVGTQRDVDVVRQKYLRQKDALTELESRRDMMPHLRAELDAKLDAARAKLAQAKEDLSHTQITCPFKARVEAVSAYKSQVVTAFFSIARLTDMEAFEITVGVDPRELRWLAPSVRPETLEVGETVDGPPVTVRWALHDQEFTWRGYVTRFERVDEITRTARMVVEIRDVDMEAAVTSGAEDDRPSLSIGMYCRAELPGIALDNALLVPRYAVHDDKFVYVFEEDGSGSESAVEPVVTGRLERRAIMPLRRVGDQVLVDYSGRKGTEVCELAPGERVVVSPLARPVEGMRIRLRGASAARYAPLRASEARVALVDRTLGRSSGASQSSGVHAWAKPAGGCYLAPPPSGAASRGAR